MNNKNCPGDKELVEAEILNNLQRRITEGFGELVLTKEEYFLLKQRLEIEHPKRIII
ncbi:MAG: hypothetical protein WC222_05145 [Parachlamydiales bacterium]|jgi:hypothetical protein